MLNLEPIKARAEAASPGPWADGAAELDLPGFTMSPRTCAGCGVDWPLDAPDAEFVAHAREDVPALIAEVERLRKLIATAAEKLEDDEDTPEVPDVNEWADGHRVRNALRVLREI